jgi:hypothetical protein
MTDSIDYSSAGERVLFGEKKKWNGFDRYWLTMEMMVRKRGTKKRKKTQKPGE